MNQQENIDKLSYQYEETNRGIYVYVYVYIYIYMCVYFFVMYIYIYVYQLRDLNNLNLYFWLTKSSSLPSKKTGQIPIRESVRAGGIPQPNASSQGAKYRGMHQQKI